MGLLRGPASDDPVERGPPRISAGPAQTALPLLPWSYQATYTDAEADGLRSAFSVPLPAGNDPEADGLRSAFSVPLPAGNDPDAGDRHTATISWGDGASETTAATDGAIRATHSYTTLGAFTVTTCVTDIAGARVCASMSVTPQATAKELQAAAKMLTTDAKAECRDLGKSECSTIKADAKTDAKDLKSGAKALSK